MTEMYGGWIPIERYANRYKHEFCETERHSGTFTRSATICCITHTSEDGNLIWGVCKRLEGLHQTGFPVDPLTHSEEDTFP